MQSLQRNFGCGLKDLRLIGTLKNQRKKEPVDPPGATQQRFKLYEAACLLAHVEPAWPLPNQFSRDKSDFLVHAVRVHDPDVKYVELRVVIPSYAIRPLDLTNFALRQHTYISQLRIRDEQQVSRYHSGTPMEGIGPRVPPQCSK